MWRPPLEEDIKPHPAKNAPPAKVQSEKTDRWHVDPIAEICQRPRAAEPGLAGSDTCVEDYPVRNASVFQFGVGYGLKAKGSWGRLG